MTEEDKVVDSDYRLDACLPDADGQLTGKAMIDVYAVTFQVSYDATATPMVTPYPGYEGRMLCVADVGRIDKGHCLSDIDHIAEVCFPSMRSIQPQLAIVGSDSGKVVDKGTSIGTQPGSVGHYSLGVKSYPHLFNWFGATSVVAFFYIRLRRYYFLPLIYVKQKEMFVTLE